MRMDIPINLVILSIMVNLPLHGDLYEAAKRCGFELVTKSNYLIQMNGITRTVILCCCNQQLFKTKNIGLGFSVNPDRIMKCNIPIHSTVYSKKKKYSNIVSQKPDI